MNGISLGVVVFMLSTLLAVTEIEIEGENGWATDTKTFRKKINTGSLLSRFTWGTEVTGYHLFLNSFVILFFHIPYVFGVPLSLANELFIISIYLLMGILWDFLWFVLNPYYGIKNFKKEKIAWFNSNFWLYKERVPFKYILQIISSFILVFLSWQTGNILIDTTNYMYFILAVLFMLSVAILVSPLYHKFYKRMRM